MKNTFLIASVLLFLGACKKEDDAPVSLSKSDLIGVWDIEKYEEYSLPGNSINSTDNFVSGSFTWTFRSDDTAVIYQAGTPSSTTYFTYSILSSNGKNTIVTRELGSSNDDYTLQIIKFDLPYMECDNKEALTKNGDDHYDKYYLKKQ